MNVHLVRLDGSLPNLAIMKLAGWHLDRGDTVHVTRQILPDRTKTEESLRAGFEFQAASC